MNVIEIQLCAEDRARLDDIIKGLAALVPSGTMSDAAEATAAPLPPAMMNAAFDAYLQRQAQVDRAREIAAAAGVLDAHPAEGDAQFALVDAPTPFDADPAPAPAPEAKPIPLPEFQKAIVTRCAESPTVKAKVQALVHKYAPSVSEIPEAKRAEVLAELAKL